MKKVMINATGLTLMLMLCISFHLHAQTDTLDMGSGTWLVCAFDR